MIIQEGKTKIFLSKRKKSKGPGRKQAGFYNPALELDRDICVLICQHAASLGFKKFLDALGATGIRGLRIANEVSGDIEVEINEINPASFKEIKRNAELNGLSIKLWNMDARILCLMHRYDYIDIDPYGSPAPFTFSAFNGLRRKGMAAFTATDKATLCGVYANACRRRYDAVPRRGMGMKEVGLRILIGFLVRQAAMNDYAAIPIFSYSHDHYFRVYLKMEKGARKSNDALKQIKFICWDDGWKINGEGKCAGPLWTGKILDGKLLSFIKKEADKKELGKKDEIKKLLLMLSEEKNAPPMHYETSFLCKNLKIRQPKIDLILNELKQRGFFACRTHFSQDAFKTDAPLKEIENVLLSIHDSID